MKKLIAILVGSAALALGAEGPAPAPEAAGERQQITLPDLKDYQTPAKVGGDFELPSAPLDRRPPNPAPISPLRRPDALPNKKETEKDKDWFTEGLKEKARQKEVLRKQNEKELQEKQNKINPMLSSPTGNENQPFSLYKPLDLNRTMTPWGTVAPKGLYQSNNSLNREENKMTSGRAQNPGWLSSTPPNATPWHSSGSEPLLLSKANKNSEWTPIMPSLLKPFQSTLTTSTTDPRLDNRAILKPLDVTLSQNQAQPQLLKPKTYVPPPRPSVGPKTKSMSKIEDPWDILTR